MNRETALTMKIGDPVFTDYTGRLTKHIIVDILTDSIADTGIAFKVNPIVPGSALENYKEDVISHPPWISAGWFFDGRQK